MKIMENIEHQKGMTLFLRGKRKGEKNNQSRGQKSYLSARSLIKPAEKKSELHQIKNQQILWEWMRHFHKLLCEEMIFLLHKGEKWWTEVRSHHKGFLMQKYPFIPVLDFYVFCRKSSNIFEKNLRTRGFIRKSSNK